MPGAQRKKAATRRVAKGAKAAKPAKKTAKRARPASKPARKTAKPARKTARPRAKVVKRPAKAKAAGKPTKKSAGKSAAKSTARPSKPARAGKPAKSTTAPAGRPASGKARAPITTKVPPARLPGPAAATEPRVKIGRGGKKIVVCELSGFEVTPSPAQLSAKTLERLRQKLVDEKQRLLHQADELAAEAEQLASEREAGDTQFDEESGEGDTVNVERERDLLLSASARQIVEEIDEALARMKKGNYGVCKYAGRKLPVERLEAIPWANVCVDCKQRADRRR